MPLPLPRSGAETPSYPPSPLRITHDGEFYARLLTRESSLANPSFRYYGAGPAAVPFGWESQPGTPKDCASCRITLSCSPAGEASVLPAITPPPSYHLRTAAAPHGRKGRRGKGAAGSDRSCGAGGRSKYCCGYRKLRWIKIGFIAAVFRRIALGRSRVSSAAESSSAASVQSSSASTRWLFSGGSSSCLEETGPQHYYHYYEAPATKGAVRLSPWTVQFCGGGPREAAGWQ